MALSENTIQRLAEALADDVASYIADDERFFDLIVELIPEAVTDKLGNVDDTVLAELSMSLSGQLRLIAI